LARETTEGGLMLIDGHLRAETATDARVPVLILDINEAEAAKLLAVLDSLAAMAEADTGKLDGRDGTTHFLTEATNKKVTQRIIET
jgi:hypothetical protein